MDSRALVRFCEFVGIGIEIEELCPLILLTNVLLVSAWKFVFVVVFIVSLCNR